MPQEIVDESVIIIKEGRHLLQELTVDGAFVPNDTYINTDKNIALITGIMVFNLSYLLLELIWMHKGWSAVFFEFYGDSNSQEVIVTVIMIMIVIMIMMVIFITNDYNKINNTSIYEESKRSK